METNLKEKTTFKMSKDYKGFKKNQYISVSPWDLLPTLNANRIKLNSIIKEMIKKKILKKVI